MTMGPDGALLADSEGERFLPVVRVEGVSAVGAGDSFLAAMVKGSRTAFRLSVAPAWSGGRSRGRDLPRNRAVRRRGRGATAAMVPDPQQVPVASTETFRI